MNKKTYSKFMVSIRLMAFKSISLLLNDLSFNKWFNHLKKNKKNKKKTKRKEIKERVRKHRYNNCFMKQKRMKKKI